jgi:hypothetical protein
MSVVLFLGAGFSKWAADLPVAGALFDFSIEPWGEREERKLALVRALKQEWDHNHGGGTSEEFIADALGFETKKREAVLWYVTRRLSDPFIWREFHSQRWRRHVLMIDENRKYGIAGVVRAQKFLQRYCNLSLSGIVTPNYDMLPEYSLGTRGFNYGFRNQRLIGRGAYPVSTWKNPVRVTGSVSVAKIHGSISWDVAGYYTDGRRGLTGRALIVAPTPEKIPPKALHQTWELAGRILKPAIELVVFGFAFNPYDEAVLNLLRDSSPNLKSVHLIDIHPPHGRAEALWPHMRITSSQPPP